MKIFWFWYIQCVDQIFCGPEWAVWASFFGGLQTPVALHFSYAIKISLCWLVALCRFFSRNFLSFNRIGRSIAFATHGLRWICMMLAYEWHRISFVLARQATSTLTVFYHAEINTRKTVCVHTCIVEFVVFENGGCRYWYGLPLFASNSGYLPHQFVLFYFKAFHRRRYTQLILRSLNRFSFVWTVTSSPCLNLNRVAN